MAASSGGDADEHHFAAATVRMPRGAEPLLRQVAHGCGVDTHIERLKPNCWGRHTFDRWVTLVIFTPAFADLTLPTAEATTAAPDFSERVPILPGLEGRLMFANGDTFSIARGAEHGVTAGAHYAIYRDRKDGKPLVHIGEAIVTEPSATASKLLLMTITDAVSTTDMAVPRR